MPLIRGRYPVTNPLWNALGQTTNTSQTDVAVRTNLQYTGVSGITDAAGLTTTKLVAVPVPVEVGDVITSVSIAIGGTPVSVSTHAFAAVYSGQNTAAGCLLLGQSTDNVTANGGMPVSAVAKFTLATPVLITTANAPQGFIWAGVAGTFTNGTCAGVTNAVAAAYSWFPNSPVLGFAVNATGTGATAQATLTTAAVQAIAPIVFLQ